jgi:hypothetical protein
VLVVIPPYPYCIEEDSHAVDLEDCWTALLQLFFSCYLRPKGRPMPKTGYDKTRPDDLRYESYGLVLQIVWACTTWFLQQL